MPYVAIADLPDTVRSALPRTGQLIYRAAFNNAWLRGHDEAACHRIAWSAVKRRYRKSPDGRWAPIAGPPAG